MNTARILRFVSIGLLSISAAAACGFVWLKIQGGAVLSVQSGSMEPAIAKGDLVAVKSASDYKVGDAITYTNADKTATITHRIRAIEKDEMSTRYITRGDANPADDGPVYKRSIVGKTIFSVPYLGFVADIMRTPLGLAVLIYLPALSIVIAEVKRLAAHLGPTVRYSLNRQKSLKGSYHAAMLGFLLVPFVFTAHSSAALQSTASLTGNTISTASRTPANPDGGSSCTSNTSINVENNTSQTATSGSVNNSQNGSSGQSSSGSASNSSSTSLSVSIDGC